MIAAASCYQAFTNAVLLHQLRLLLRAELYSCTSHFKSVWAVLPGGSGGDTVTVGTNCFWLCANLCNFEIFPVLLFVYMCTHREALYMHILT